MSAPPAPKLVDVNVSLSRYPFRRLPLDEPAALVAKLRSLGVTRAWAGSFDALLHRDIAGVNVRLADECRTHGGGVLLPMGAVNPMLPDWQDDVRRCAEDHGMRGIRLHPNYHGYKLNEPVFVQLLQEARRYKLLVQIVDHVEDERTHHPLLRVPPVEWGAAADVLAGFADVLVVLLNAVRGARGEPLHSLTKLEHVSFDVAALEGAGGVRNVLDRLPPERLLFGSHAPFFYPEAAVMKLAESGLEGDVAEKVGGGNAGRFIP